MAVIITATAGSTTANSFVTLAEAETYMEARLNASVWDAATDDTKNRALVESRREIDAMVWQGERTTEAQALAWPREWVWNPDNPDGDYYDEDVIPTRVKNATMELAFQFVIAGSTDVAALDSSVGVIREKVDVIEVQYDSAFRTKGLDRYPRVMAWLRPLLAGAGGLVTPTLRG